MHAVEVRPCVVTVDAEEAAAGDTVIVIRGDEVVTWGRVVQRGDHIAVRVPLSAVVRPGDELAVVRAGLLLRPSDWPYAAGPVTPARRSPGFELGADAGGMLGLDRAYEARGWATWRWVAPVAVTLRADPMGWMPAEYNVYGTLPAGNWGALDVEAGFDGARAGVAAVLGVSKRADDIGDRPAPEAGLRVRLGAAEGPSLEGALTRQWGAPDPDLHVGDLVLDHTVVGHYDATLFVPVGGLVGLGLRGGLMNVASGDASVFTTVRLPLPVTAGAVSLRFGVGVEQKAAGRAVQSGRFLWTGLTWRTPPRSPP